MSEFVCFFQLQNSECSKYKLSVGFYFVIFLGLYIMDSNWMIFALFKTVYLIQCLYYLLRLIIACLHFLILVLPSYQGLTYRWTEAFLWETLSPICKLSCAMCKVEWMPGYQSTYEPQIGYLYKVIIHQQLASPVRGMYIFLVWYNLGLRQQSLPFVNSWVYCIDLFCSNFL